MKKVYIKPVVEIEAYTLSEAIAANCQTIVDAGPGDGFHTACDSWKGSFDMVSGVMEGVEDEPFYDDGYGKTCTCYYTSGTDALMTS